jgi:2-polyprenyl-3-methyl-5-hydroxy-6-metoxy-1,4-benzoquinol methylase
LSHKYFLCPICGESDFQVLKHKDDRLLNKIMGGGNQEIYSSSSSYKLFDQLVKCFICAHVMTNPRLETEDLISNYSNALDNKHHLQNELRVTSFEYALKKIIKKLGINPDDKTLNALDIGCASGAFLLAASRLTNWNVEGIEPSKQLAEFGIQQYELKIKQGLFQIEEYRNKRLNIISLWDVLEHVNEPGQLINEIAASLIEGGYLIINVPNLDSFFARLLGYSWPFYLAVHIHYFNNQTMKKILINHDLEICYSKPYFQKLGLGYTIYRMSKSISLELEFNRFFKLLDIIPIWYNMGQTTFVARKLI